MIAAEMRFAAGEAEATPTQGLRSLDTAARS